MSMTQDYPRLIDALDDLRRRWRAGRLAEGALVALAVSLATLLLVVAIDNLFALGTLGRCALAAGLWGSLAWGASRLATRGLEQRRDDFFAILVERHYPGLSNRLINALQLGRGNQDGHSPRLIEAIVSDAARDTSELDMGASLDTRPTRRAAIAATAVALVVGTYALVFLPRFLNGASRVLLPWADIPPYTATQIPEKTVVPGDAKVPEGTAVAVSAKVDGVIPGTAQLLRKDGEGRWVPIEMKADTKARDLFAASTPPAGASFDYAIAAGDGRSRTFRVEVVKRPRVAKIAPTYTFPPYTGLVPRKAAEAEADGEVAAVAGTAVALELTATKPLQSASIVTERGEPLTLNKAGDDRTWRASFLLGGRDLKLANVAAMPVIQGPTRYQVKMVDADGYEGADTLWRPVVVLKDLPPSVSISAPGRDLQVKPDATVAVTIEAKDDFGLAEVRLHFRVNDEPTVRDLQTFPHAGKPVLQQSHRFDWALSGSKLKGGDVVQYWATATDRNPLNGPGRGESRKYTLTLTTPEQAVARLDLQIQDYAQILEELLKLQRQNRAQTASGLGFDALVVRQASIRGKTDKLALAMEKDALPVATIVASLRELFAGSMAEAVSLLEGGRDAANAAKATDLRNQSLPVQDKIIAELEALLARLQRNEQAKDALRKLAKKDQPAHKATTQTLNTMVNDLGRLIDDQKELTAKFERMPKKTDDAAKEERAKSDKEAEALRKAWEQWAKGSVAELAKLPTGFVDDFDVRPDVNKIFEEIEKAAARAKAEKIEVALEDMGVGLATRMKEDLEMWMPDAPDASKWVMEEPLNKKPINVPEMPLPNATEDMVGDLLQKADEFDEEADDITSAWGDNLDQAGWGVSDGPISSFSAKGKTGNDQPNNMEVSGRSGDGRRGKSSGQMTGDTARALPGRKTPARVGNERYEPGQLKQEGQDDPNGATGGGKRAGTGRKGLQGGTPPDFAKDMGRLSDKQAGLRAKAEQVAKTLETSGVVSRRLKEGIDLMKAAENDLRDLRYDDAARKRRVAQGKLKAIPLELEGSSAAQLSRARDLPGALRSELIQAADEGYPAGYETLLKSYYKALSTAEE